MSWSPNFRAASAPSITRPVDQDLLGADAGPFHKGDRDAPVAAGGDGLEHPPVGDRRGIAFALQLELVLVDAARHVGCEHQQQIDRLGGARSRRRGDRASSTNSIAAHAA